MSDEALRALERDARARPDDRAAAWAYARGLERAGERRALWLELCRMARAGDDDASRAVDGWVPGLGGTTPPVLASLRAPKVARVSLVRDEAFESDPVSWVVPTPDGNVLVQVGQTIVAVDPRTECVNWRQEGVAALHRCGDDALILTSERSAFLRRRGGTELIAGAGLIGAGPVEGSVCWGDRLVVYRSGLVQALELTEAFGRVLWKHEGPGVPVVADDMVLLLTDDVMEARELETGRTLWVRTREQDEGLGHTWIVHDRTGVVFHTWLERGARMISLDPRTGIERWVLTVERSEGAVAFTPSLIFADRGDQHLCAYSREDGRVVWTADVPPVEMFADYAAGPDALYVTLVSERSLRLIVLDLVTGAVRATAEAGLPSEAANGSAFPMWFSRNSVEVLVTTRTDLVVIVRFAD